MPRSGCSTWHGVSPNLKKKKKNYEIALFLQNIINMFLFIDRRQIWQYVHWTIIFLII